MLESKWAEHEIEGVAFSLRQDSEEAAGAVGRSRVCLSEIPAEVCALKLRGLRQGQALLEYRRKRY